MYLYARLFRTVLLGLVAVVSVIGVSAQDLYVRVIDVGAGECVVVKAPGVGGKHHYLIYDAGNGKAAVEGIQDVIPEDAEVDLLILSHSDADHIGAVPEIMDAYKVKRIIHSGYERTTDTWENANRAINSEKMNDDAKVLNLAESELPPGATFRLGLAHVVILSGFHKPPEDWDIKTEGEERNAGSVVVRVVYKEKSILLCGDAVGRHIGNPANVCIAAERFMLDNVDIVKIDSDVIVAPHHGADNGSSTDFIKAVSPEYVIFPAGHKHQHPTKSAAQRYLSAGVTLSKMFRTDRGDHENGAFEWEHDRVNGHSDKTGDDDVEIRVTAAGLLSVKYLNP